MTKSCFCKKYGALKEKILKAEKEYWKENEKRLKNQVIPLLKKKFPELEEAWIREMLKDGIGGEYETYILDEYTKMCSKLLYELNEKYSFCEFEHDERSVVIAEYIGYIEIEYCNSEFQLTDKEGNEVRFCPHCGKLLNDKKIIVWGEKSQGTRL